MMQPSLITAQAFVDSHLAVDVVTTPIFGLCLVYIVWNWVMKYCVVSCKRAPMWRTECGDVEQCMDTSISCWRASFGGRVIQSSSQTRTLPCAPVVLSNARMTWTRGRWFCLHFLCCARHSNVDRLPFPSTIWKAFPTFHAMHCCQGL